MKPRRPNMKRLAGLGIAACLLAMASPAKAEVTEKDLQIVARALSFMETDFVGETRMGIVFDPDNSRSRRQAEKIRDMLGDGLQAGNLSLMAVMVPLDEAKTADVDLVFMTEHLGGAGKTVAEILETKALPCVTTDIAQVRKGVCLMGVQSSPKVEILVNRRAADKTGTRFATVFRVMITEI